MHHDLVLEHTAWVRPFAVEIAGVEPCLPLFGAAPGSASAQGAESGTE